LKVLNNVPFIRSPLLGVVAKLIELFGRPDPVKYLEAGKRGAFAGSEKP
jgi:hypothetical protein